MPKQSRSQCILCATIGKRQRTIGGVPQNHTINNTMSKVCKAAGIVGFKTNHSLRATAATRLYQSGVDEQLIMEKTGHRSLEGVRSYKRTSTEQREALSDIMNRKECPE